MANYQKGNAPGVADLYTEDGKVLLPMVLSLKAKGL